MKGGRLFQSLGVDTEKALSPLHFGQECGTAKTSWFEECNDQEKE